MCGLRRPVPCQPDVHYPEATCASPRPEGCSGPASRPAGGISDRGRYVSYTPTGRSGTLGVTWSPVTSEDSARSAMRSWHAQLRGDTEAAQYAAPLLVLLDGLGSSLKVPQSTLDEAAVRRRALQRVIENSITITPSWAELSASVAGERFERWLRDLMPQTPGQVEQVRQSAIEVQEDPEYQKTIRRLVSGIRREDITGLSKWGLLVLAAAILFQISDWPVTRDLSAARDAALQNWLLTVSIIVVIAIVLAQSKHDK